MVRRCIWSTIVLLSTISVGLVIAQQAAPPAAENPAVTTEPKAGQKVEERQVEIVSLRHVNSVEAIEMLRKLIDKDIQLESAAITADQRSNSIIFRATSTQAEALKKLLKTLDDQAASTIRPTFHSPYAQPQLNQIPQVQPPMSQIPLPALPAPVPVPAQPQAQKPYAVVAPPLSAVPHYAPAVAPYPTSKEMQEFMALERQAFDLAKKYRDSSTVDGGDEKQLKELRDKLSETVKQAFEKRQQVQEGELKQLRERLAKVEASFTKRTQHREDIIEKRVKELLDEDRELRWDVAQGVLTGPNHVAVVEQGAGRGQYQVIQAQPNSFPITTRYTDFKDAISTGKLQLTPDAGLVTAGETNAYPRYYYGTPSQQNDPNAQSTTNSLSAMQHLLSEFEGRLDQEKIKLRDLQAKFGQEHPEKKSDFDLAQVRMKSLEQRIATLKREIETNRKLLEIDVESAKAKLDSVESHLQLARERHKNGVETDAEVNKFVAELRQAQLQLERAKTVLDLYSKSAESATQNDPNAGTPPK